MESQSTYNFDVGDSRNLSMLFDFYEITMGNGYILSNKENVLGTFDLFFRKIPDNGGYAIFAGLNQVINYCKNLHFTKKDIDYLRTKNIFDEKFLTYLLNFEFKCDIVSLKEGTVVFPYEPILIVTGPLIQAQLIETMLLLCINHQTLIATKSSRICRAASGRPVMEFGSRRAHSFDAAIYGARAAFIGGCGSTSCTYSDELLGTPAIGTMAHSWVQSFPNEYESFKAWAEIYPDNCVLLIDTFHVLNSGIVNAVKVYQDVLKPKGKILKGVRLDSGDLVDLSKKCRKYLDEHGATQCKIIASNSLDEYSISKMFKEGACLDSFGVGERLITSKSEPVFGGVYKLSAIKNPNDKDFTPKIKISETPEKTTNPGVKRIVRVTDKDNGQFLCDVIALRDEILNNNKELTLNNGKKINNYVINEIMVDVFKNGKLVYPEEKLIDMQKRAKEHMQLLDPKLLSFEPVKENYPVILSEKLDELKTKMIKDESN